MDNSSSGGGAPSHGSSQQSLDAALKLQILDDQLAAEHRALDRQKGLLQKLVDETDGQRTTQSLLRLLVMLDHSAHLARRCVDLAEQRRALLAANPALAHADKAGGG